MLVLSGRASPKCTQGSGGSASSLQAGFLHSRNCRGLGSCWCGPRLQYGEGSSECRVTQVAGVCDCECHGVNIGEICSPAGCWFFQCQNLLGSSAEQDTGKQLFCCVANTGSPCSSIPLGLNSSQPCWPLGGVKRKWVLCAVPKRLGSWSFTPLSFS